MLKKNCAPEFKANVALEAIKGEKAVSPIASEFRLHPVMVNRWKREKASCNHGELYEQIGQLNVERDFLLKKLKQV